MLLFTQLVQPLALQFLLAEPDFLQVHIFGTTM